MTTSTWLSWLFSIFLRGDGGSPQILDPTRPDPQMDLSSSSSRGSFSESLMPPEDERKPNIDYTTVAVEITIFLKTSETSSQSTITSPPTRKSSYNINVSLWLHDQRLSCASAALVETQLAQLIPKDSSPTASTRVVFTPIDKLSTVTQVGKTYNQMVEPSMYIALDFDTESDVSYAKGSSPAFRLRFGDVGKIDVVPKWVKMGIA